MVVAHESKYNTTNAYVVMFLCSFFGGSTFSLIKIRLAHPLMFSYRGQISLVVALFATVSETSPLSPIVPPSIVLLTFLPALYDSF